MPILLPHTLGGEPLSFSESGSAFSLRYSTAERIAVGFCDLGLAAAIYLLFLLLQGHAPAHDFWWAPKTTLVAAFLAAILVVLRALLDIVSSRAALTYIQCLYADFLMRLTQGYNEMQWGWFVQRNRSELSNHALHTAREAADFYHRCIEMTAGVVTIAAMTAAFVYQSPMVAVAFGCALAGFYCVHRLLIRRRIHEAAANREKALGKLQRNLADMFLSGRRYALTGTKIFFTIELAVWPSVIPRRTNERHFCRKSRASWPIKAQCCFFSV